MQQEFQLGELTTQASAARHGSCDCTMVVVDEPEHINVAISGPTLSVAISHAVQDLLLAEDAVLGVRRQGEFRRSYGSWEVTFPKAESRPVLGYKELGVRASVDFGHRLEIFDVRKAFKIAEGRLRYRAQELGNDTAALQTITEGVSGYVDAALDAMLWVPGLEIDLATRLSDLFLCRDWKQFISPEILKAPDVTVSDVRLLQQTDDDEWLISFHYVNGDDSGYEVEFADLGEGKLVVRRNGYSALRSAMPAFRGNQLKQVYDKLQAMVDRL